MSLAALSEAYEDMRLKVALTAAELEEIEDLLCMAILERNLAAVEWLVVLAEAHQARYRQRKEVQRDH